MRKATAPSEVTIWSYGAGLVNSSLLEIVYVDDTRRYVLLDFGTVVPGTRATSALGLQVALDVKQRCSGKLDALVASGRRQDQIGGLSTSDSGKGMGDIIASLNPTVVIRPWTERPLARQSAAKSHEVQASRNTHALRAHAGMLGDLQAIVSASAALSKRMRNGVEREVGDAIAALAANNATSASALENLVRMGRRGRARSARVGGKSGLESVLPGVKVRVLAPPALGQLAGLASRKPPQQLWDFCAVQALAIGGAGGGGAERPRVGSNRLFPRAATERDPQWARWFRSRVTEAYADSTLQLLRTVDQITNDLSVVLLFEIQDARLLFPGNAPIEGALGSGTMHGIGRRHPARSSFRTADLVKPERIVIDRSRRKHDGRASGGGS